MGSTREKVEVKKKRKYLGFDTGERIEEEGVPPPASS